MGELLFEKMKYIRDGSTNALALLVPRFKVDVLFLIWFSLLITVCVWIVVVGGCYIMLTVSNVSLYVNVDLDVVIIEYNPIYI